MATSDSNSLKGIARVGDQLIMLLELSKLLDESGCRAASQAA
ncbi:MAG TPA: hypothetical protein VF337_12760 [Candidatus Limnocylindrales bacterium]